MGRNFGKNKENTFFALITGLGFAFQGTTLRRKLLTRLVSFLYRIALKIQKQLFFKMKIIEKFLLIKILLALQKHTLLMVPV